MWHISYKPLTRLYCSQLCLGVIADIARVHRPTIPLLALPMSVSRLTPIQSISLRTLATQQHFTSDPASPRPGLAELYE